MTQKSRPAKKPIRTWIIALVVLLACSAAAAVAIARNRAPLLRFTPSVYANPDPHGCLGAVGVYFTFYANLTKPPTSKAEYQRIARANTPTKVRLEIGGTTYSPTLDRGTSLIGNEQVDWNFRTVKVSTTTAHSLIGKRATIHYRLGRAARTQTTTVADGRCKSLI